MSCEKDVYLSGRLDPRQVSRARLELRVSIHTELNHHAGAGIDTLAALDTLRLINLKMCFLFCSHGVILSDFSRCCFYYTVTDYLHK